MSEALFFVAIFWAFFHSALTPTVELGAQWPPMGIEPINPFELPLLNTVILLSSGATITFAHHVRGQCSCITSLLKDIYFSHIYAVHELGRGENPLLNIASHAKIKSWLNLLYLDVVETALSRVKAWLLEIHCSSSSRKGNCLGRDGTFETFCLLNGGKQKWEVFTSYVRNIIKNKSGQPKESEWIHTATPGLPKGSNSYGNRATIVLKTIGNTVDIRGRVAVKNAFTSRNYSTGSTTDLESNVMNKLKDLYIRSQKFVSEPIDRNLYKLLCDTEILVIAYDKLKSKPGQMTPGVKPETLDGMSIEVLEEIAEKLKNESFQFQPGRRVQKLLVVLDL